MNLNELGTILIGLIPVIIATWFVWGMLKDHRNSMRDLDELRNQIEFLGDRIQSLSHSPSPSHAYYDEDEDEDSDEGATISPSASVSESFSVSPSPSEEPYYHREEIINRTARNIHKIKSYRPTCTHCHMPITKDTALCPYCGAPQL